MRYSGRCGLFWFVIYYGIVGLYQAFRHIGTSSFFRASMSTFPSAFRLIIRFAFAILKAATLTIRGTL